MKFARVRRQFPRAGAGSFHGALSDADTETIHLVPGGCDVYPAGPITARAGKRPSVSAQSPEFEHYLTAEFEGGGTLRDFQKKLVMPAVETVPPTPPARPATSPIRFVEAADDVRRTKPIRVPSGV